MKSWPWLALKFVLNALFNPVIIAVTLLLQSGRAGAALLYTAWLLVLYIFSGNFYKNNFKLFLQTAISNFTAFLSGLFLLAFGAQIFYLAMNSDKIETAANSFSLAWVILILAVPAALGMIADFIKIAFRK